MRPPISLCGRIPDEHRSKHIYLRVLKLLQCADSHTLPFSADIFHVPQIRSSGSTFFESGRPASDVPGVPCWQDYRDRWQNPRWPHEKAGSLIVSQGVSRSLRLITAKSWVRGAQEALRRLKQLYPPDHLHRDLRIFLSDLQNQSLIPYTPASPLHTIATDFPFPASSKAIRHLLASWVIGVVRNSFPGYRSRSRSTYTVYPITTSHFFRVSSAFRHMSPSSPGPIPTTYTLFSKIHTPFPHAKAAVTRFSHIFLKAACLLLPRMPELPSSHTLSVPVIPLQRRKRRTPLLYRKAPRKNTFYKAGPLLRKIPEFRLPLSSDQWMPPAGKPGMTLLLGSSLQPVSRISARLFPFRIRSTERPGESDAGQDLKNPFRIQGQKG